MDNKINIIEKHRNFIIDLLKDVDEEEIHNLITLKNYIKNNNVDLKSLNNKDFDIVIFSIESNAATEIIKFIIEQLPLFSAIRKENFEIADLLIQYNADINYLANDKQNVAVYLYDCYHCIYKPELKYILKKGFFVNGFTTNLINDIILDGYNFNLLKSIFNFRIFDEAFVLNLLSIYKNKFKLSKKQLNSLIRKEKSKIKIEDSMYKNVLRCEYYESLVLLLKYDSDDPFVILDKIQKYDLLNVAIKNVEYNLMVEVLTQELLSFDFKHLEKIFIEESRNNDIRFVLGILLENLFKQKPCIISSTQFENILLSASKVNNLNIMSLLLKLLLNGSRSSNDQFKILTSESPNIRTHIEMIMNENVTLKDRFKFVSKESTVIIDKLKEILKKSQNLNITEGLKVTLIKNCDTRFLTLILNLAIKTNNFEVVKYLIENKELSSKLDINTKDRNNEFPIIIAQDLVTNDLTNIKIFKFLLDHHANTNLDKFGYSLLCYAIIKNDLKTIEYLMDHNVNINLKKNKYGYGHSVLDIAIQTGNKDAFLILINNDKININTTNSQEELALITLLKSKLYSSDDKFLMLECILKKGSDINVTDNNGKSAIAYAIQESSLSLPLVKLFIEYGACIDFADGNKNLPIVYAIKEKSLELVKLFIEQGVDANTVDIFNFSLLAYAIQEKSLPLVKYLVEHGADVNFVIRNLEVEKTQSMLLYAMEFDDLSIVKYLLEHHAQYDFTQEKDIYRIIKILYKHETTKILEYLIENWISVKDITSKILKGIIWRNRIDILKILMAHHLNIEMIEKQEQSFSLLITAIYTRNINNVKYLLENGMDIERVNQRINAIEKTIFFNEFDILKVLVEHHLDINAVDRKGDTPLIYAIKNRNINVIEYLLKAGANVNYNESRDGSIEDINRQYNLTFHLSEYKKIKKILNKYKFNK
ncbi:ankyrin repeat-containing domain protein [Neocallimastix lanati (nom. inval.)]|nr:ankyrin repeat-containing domain protein [Neocallimastix sp. JGI-2020a]